VHSSSSAWDFTQNSVNFGGWFRIPAQPIDIYWLS
jgi:hypothetical protein